MVHRVSVLVFALLIGCGAEVTDSDQETGVQPFVNNATDSPVEQNCAWGWFRYGTRCFKFVSTTRTWAESERYCVMMGANLASVHSTEEYYFIQELVRTHTHDTPYTWIGGCDAAQEGLWLWSDGTRFDYSHWDPSNPDNKYAAEHCAQMNYGGSLRWNDVPCHYLYPSVCSKEL